MPRPATLPRRLGAAFYDLLVVCALWMLVYFPLIAAGLMDGALDDSFDPRHLLLRGAIAFGYFGWSWTHGGRTLGALAWSLELRRDDGAPLGWSDAARRFGAALVYLAPLALLEVALPEVRSPTLYFGALLAPFLLGAAWSLRDPQGRAWHELRLATRLVRVGAVA